MIKNLSKIFLVAILCCIAVYIGVFIGRTSSSNIQFYSNEYSYETGGDLGKLDLNTVSANDLTNIPGVTPSVAKTIVKHREKYGRFYKVKELLDVEGVTKELYQIICQYVTVED